MGIFGFAKKDSKKVTELHMTIDSATDEVIPIEKRIKGKSPVCDGLYPHEVLVLSYAPKFYSDQNEFQGFWWYKYGIEDVQKELDSLLERGFIQVGTLEDAINSETLTVIKSELKNHGLKVSGKKAILVKNLVENVPEEELLKVFTRRPFSLTELGRDTLKKYEWIPYIHSHMFEDLNIWNLTDMVMTPPYMKYRDVIWGYFNKCCQDHIKARNFGLYRNTRFEMSEFLAEEGRTEPAFDFLCEVCDYDLSGAVNCFDIKYLDIYAKSFFPYEHSTVTVAPGIINRMVKYQSELGWDQDTLTKKISAEIANTGLPFRIFTNEECVEIILAEMDGDKDRVSKIYTVAEKRFKKKYKIKCCD